MSDVIRSIVGSGQQPYRKENHGKRHNLANMVFITNFEDEIPAYNIRTQTVTSIGAATVLPSGGNYAGRRELRIFNNSNNILYIGASGVSATNGYPVAPSGGMTLAVAASIDVYGFAASGSNIRVIEIA